MPHLKFPAGLLLDYGGSSLRVPHPNSPAGRNFDYGSSLGVPHPNSPAGRNFDYMLSHGVPHPDPPAGRNFDYASNPNSGSELDRIKAEISDTIARNKINSSADVANRLSLLFMRAVVLMDFLTEPNEGILYSGEQSGVHMSNVAKLYAEQHGKKPLAWTKDGRWLNSWEPLKIIVGPKNADQIWFAASIRYSELLVGDVIIFLATPDYDAVFRRRGVGEQRALYSNKKVKRILYVIEHPAPGFDQPKKAPNGRAWFFPSTEQLDDFLMSNP